MHVRAHTQGEFSRNHIFLSFRELQFTKLFPRAWFFFLYLFSHLDQQILTFTLKISTTWNIHFSFLFFTFKYYRYIIISFDVAVSIIFFKFQFHIFINSQIFKQLIFFKTYIYIHICYKIPIFLFLISHNPVIEISKKNGNIPAAELVNTQIISADCAQRTPCYAIKQRHWWQSSNYLRCTIDRSFTRFSLDEPRQNRSLQIYQIRNRNPLHNFIRIKKRKRKRDLNSHQIL